MTINFNSKLYNLKAIKNSVDAYKELAVFTVEKNKNNISVKITDIDNEVKDILKDEFCNYVLSEHKKNENK
jgi:hypothetical protein